MIFSMTTDRKFLGIKEIDELSNGNITGLVITLFGNSKFVKQKLLTKIIENPSDHVLNISTMEEPDSIRKRFEHKSMHFIDGISWRSLRVDPKQERKHEKYALNNLADLNNILSKITQACKDNPEINRIVFDSPSSILLYSTPSKEQVYRFLELLFSFTRNRRITTVLAIRDGIHDAMVNSTIRFLSDVNLDYKYENSQSLVKISEFHIEELHSDWIEIK